ncbi:hypothetical protein BHM03_00060705 [Ensete ventricosum]|nr:hypothetical protein BHM03_00060705 [Ensete ventricosum]
MATSGKLTGRLSRRGDFRYVVVYYRKPPSRLGTAAGGPPSRNDMPHVTVGVRRVFNVRLWERGTVSGEAINSIAITKDVSYSSSLVCGGSDKNSTFLVIIFGFFVNSYDYMQLEVSTDQDLNQQIPQFNLPSKILCRVVNVTLKVGYISTLFLS